MRSDVVHLHRGARAGGAAAAGERGDVGQVQAGGLGERQIRPLAQQVCAPDQLVQAAHAEGRQPSANLLCHEVEVVDLRASKSQAPQVGRVPLEQQRPQRRRMQR